MIRLLLLAPLLLAAAPQSAAQMPVWDQLAAGPGGYDAALAEELHLEGRGAELFPDGENTDLGLSARRARARWFERYGDPEALEGALLALRGEADRDTRRDLLHGLSSHVTEATARASVATGFEELANNGPVPGLSIELIVAATALGGVEGAGLLDGWIDEWAAPDRWAAARALGELRAGAPLVAARLESALVADSAQRPDDGVHSALLLAYGRRWGEDRDALDTPHRRAPIELGLRHPSPGVRRAAMGSVELFLTACRRLETPERADNLLAALATGARDPRVFEAMRAVHALSRGMDPALAVVAAERIEGSPLADPAGEWTARAAYYRGMAAMAAGDLELASSGLDRAAALHDEALARRVDLARGSDGILRPGTQAGHAERLHERAAVELARCILALAEGRPATDPRVLELSRRTHALSLEAQVAQTSGDGLLLGSFDQLLEPNHAPTRLLFSRPPHRAWSVDRSFHLRAELGRACASVAAFEFPGFEPIEGLVPALADPEQDPQRRRWLDALPLARRRELQSKLRRLEGRLREASQGGERLTPEQETEIAILRWRLGRVSAEEPPMEELRAPSSMALWFAEDLRENGRSAEARALAQALLHALEALELDAKTGMGLNLAIEAQLIVGGSLTDEGSGEEAEEHLLRAVERLEGLENLLEERGGSDAGLRAVRARRAGALVSLAVNANVKLGETQRALEYFERAHALDSSEAGDVLLACYRARMGQESEARALLAEVLEAPGSYYNFACTHALLGDADRALEYLEKDFRENHATEGSLKRQQAWAETDPDLESLREDVRFQRLIAADAGELIGR